jgi:hypothetical protein
MLFHHLQFREEMEVILCSISNFIVELGYQNFYLTVWNHQENSGTYYNSQ